MQSEAERGVAVCILAGGAATRFPGKLERPLSGVPLLRLVYENLRGIGPVTVSVRDAAQAAVLAGAGITVVTDTEPDRGPLEGLISAFSSIAEPWVYVVAGDAPFAGRELFEALKNACEPGCEAAVPVDTDGTLQPLCAFYHRTAFLREAARPAARRSGAVRRVVEGLRAVRVRHLNERAFYNINTEAEYRAAHEDAR